MGQSEICNDEIDNDMDLLINCADPDCDCPNAFPCSNLLYQYISGDLKSWDGEKWENVPGWTNQGYNVNAMGYNVQDGFMYAIDKNDGNLLTISKSGIDASVDIGLSGLPAYNWHTADMDLNGNLYVSSALYNEMYIINVKTLTKEHVYFSGLPSANLEVADWTYLPATDKLYGVITISNTLRVMNLDGSHHADIEISNLYCNDFTGAMFSDSFGNLYASCNTGEFYLLSPNDDFTSFNATILANTAVTSSNDGASCALAEGLITNNIVFDKNIIETIINCDSTIICMEYMIYNNGVLNFTNGVIFEEFFNNSIIVSLESQTNFFSDINIVSGIGEDKIDFQEFSLNFGDSIKFIVKIKMPTVPGFYSSQANLWLDFNSSLVNVQSFDYTNNSLETSFFIEDLSSSILIENDYILCQGDSIFFNNTWVFDEVIVIDSFINSLGCDSIVVNNINAIPENITETEIFLCGNEIITIGDLTISDAGLYQEVYESEINGCDSIVNYKVEKVNSSILVENNYLLCYGDSVYINNNWVFDESAIIDSLKNSFGCDSIVVSNVYSIPENVTEIEIYLCENDTITIDDQTISDSGLYQKVFESEINGCDSTVNYNVEKLSSSLSAENDYILCQGDSIFINNTWVFDEIIVIDSFINSLGCDSIVVNNIVAIPENITETEIFLCGNETITIDDDLTISDSGLYQEVYESEISGCDSIVNYNVKKIESGKVYLPNTIVYNSPLNGCFKPFFPNNQSISYSLEIYDRWGEKVFNENGEDICWDGTLKNNKVQLGVYAYMLRIDYECHQKPIYGTITLIN